MTLTRRVFLAGAAAFMAFRGRPPHPPKPPPSGGGVYSATYAMTY